MPSGTPHNTLPPAAGPLPDTASPELRQALAEAKARLEKTYGERLRRVVLYGSHARGEARPDSDVDVLVVLGGPVHAYEELKRLVEVEITLSEEHQLHFSLQPYDEETYQQPHHPFMTHVRREGIEL